MARHNLILGNDKAFRESAYAGFDRSAGVDDRRQYGYGAPQAGQSAPQSGYGAPQQGYGVPQQYGQPQRGFGRSAPSRDDLESMYARPSATGHDTGRMTMRDALNAITATIGVVMVVGFAVGLLPAVLSVVMGPDGESIGLMAQMGALLVGALVGLVLGFVNAFMRMPSPILVLAYAVFQGMFLGGFSGLIDRQFAEQTGGASLALQAVIATFAVAGTVLVLYRMGILRTSPRLTKIFMVAMIGYLVFSIVNIGVVFLTGGSLRDGVLGLVVGAFAVILASYSLVMDFEDVSNGVRNGVPRRLAWRCAFGIAATLIWMYVEILRILAILRNN